MFLIFCNEGSARLSFCASVLGVICETTWPEQHSRCKKYPLKLGVRKINTLLSGFRMDKQLYVSLDVDWVVAIFINGGKEQEYLYDMKQPQSS